MTRAEPRPRAPEGAGGLESAGVGAEGSESEERAGHGAVNPEGAGESDRSVGGAVDSARALLGVVLAGGRSRRFGSPKAVATFAGEPLWKRATRALEALGIPVLVLANDPDVAAAIDRPNRPDARPDRGPLAGVETGLLEARERKCGGVLVLACDLVLVDVEMLRNLVAEWTGAGAVAFEAPGPWGIEPLCAIWGLDLLPTVTAALDSGRGSPGAVLADVPHARLSLRSVAPSADPRRIFRSANRPDDLADLEPGVPPRD